MMNKRIVKIISALAAFIGIFLVSFYGRYQTEAQRPKAVSARVIEVHDGDTISILFDSKSEKVRLIGIDAPELNQRPWGLRAKNHLKELIMSSQWIIILEFDIEKRDKYGRFLCYGWTSDGKMINVQMLKDGYAMLFTFPPNIRYVDEFRKAQKEARQKGLGIWSGKGLKESPYKYRKKHF